MLPHPDKGEIKAPFLSVGLAIASRPLVLGHYRSRISCRGPLSHQASIRDSRSSDSNSTRTPGPPEPTSTSNPGFGVAHITCTEPDENEIAVDPPTRWNVLVSLEGAAAVVAGAAVVATVVVVDGALVVVVDRLVVAVDWFAVAGLIVVAGTVGAVDGAWVERRWVVGLEIDAARVVAVVEEPLSDRGAVLFEFEVEFEFEVVVEPLAGSTDVWSDAARSGLSSSDELVPVERFASPVGSASSPSLSSPSFSPDSDASAESDSSAPCSGNTEAGMMSSSTTATPVQATATAALLPATHSSTYPAIFHIFPV